MKVFDLLLAVCVTAIWGFNFVVIKIGLVGFSPLLLAALRFLFCFFPAIFFFKKPNIPFRYVLAYGLVLGVFEFSLLFVGIHLGMSPGLASLVLQLQVFFTVLLGAVVLKEDLRAQQILGMLIAFSGIALIATITDRSTNIVAMLLVVGAAASWGVANTIVKKIGKVDMLNFIVWSSIIPPIPLFSLSLALDGYGSIVNSLKNFSWISLAAVLYIAYPTTLFGYALWNRLLSRYKTSTVAPFTLLVPIFGMLGSLVVFNESFGIVKLVAVFLVMIGLVVNLFGFPLTQVAGDVRQQERTSE